MFRLERDINPSRQPLSLSTDLSNDIVVHRYSILGTTFVRYEVLEPSRPTGMHSTITFLRGRWYGDYTTRRLPAEIDALPASSQERLDAVRAFQHELERQAEAMIRAAFPADFAD